MHYEGIIIRPPSEARSILLQVTVGCSHNQCAFCGTYKSRQFKIKPDEIISADIAEAAATQADNRRLFICDGDALIIPQRRLLSVFDEIRTRLPRVTRVGMYANAKSLLLKSPEELAALRERGLGVVYLGLESGDDAVLSAVGKGSDSTRMIEAARKAKQAGIKLSVTVLLGIAGKKGSQEHARQTARVLSAMDPDYASALTLMLIPGTPLYEAQAFGEFALPEPAGLLAELRTMIAETQMNGLFLANHASNYLPIQVRLPRDRQRALEQIDAAICGQIALKPEQLRGL